MEELDNLIKNKGDGSTVERVPNPNFDPTALLKKTTGLDIDPSSFPETPKQAENESKRDPVTAEEFEQLITVDEHLIEEKRPEEHVTIPTPEEVSHIGDRFQQSDVQPEPKTPVNPIAEGDRNDENEAWIKLSPDTNFEKVRQDRIKAQQESKTNIVELMDSVMGDEEKRLEHAEQITSNKEEYQKVFGAEQVTRDPKVVYSGNVVSEAVQRKQKGFNPVAEEANNGIDIDDLVPAYGDEDETSSTTVKDDSPKAEDDSDAPPDPNDVDAYRDYIRSMEVVKLDPVNSAVKVVKDRQIDTVPVRENKAGKFLGDQSFMNAITKFKKDNFKVVSVPMVNSGFILDVVGTGGIDLIQLYTRVNNQTSQMDYDIEKMRTIIKNVVGTHPRIDPMQLRNYIHYRDYNMMAWGHICATLDTVEIVANCDECGKPFRITSSPDALLMNMDEILQRKREIEAADDIAKYSLLMSNRKLTTANRFEVTIGHPTYSEIIQNMGQLRRYASEGNLSQLEMNRFIGMADVLYQIRGIKMPNGVVTSNIYQVYLALNMLDEDDYQLVEHEIELMRKEIMEPKFGIATVTCPHCHHVIHDIPYNDLDELVFYHTMVSRMLNIGPTEQSESK